MEGNVVDIRKHKRSTQRIRYFDYGLVVMTALLMGFGLLMLYSTSSFDARIEYADPAYYLKRQLFSVGIGVVGAILATYIGLPVLKALSIPVYIGSLILCLLVIFLGSEGGGASRWFLIGGISIQPSEICKVAVIVFMAYIIDKYYKYTNRIAFVLRAFVYVLPAFAIVAYNSLSAAVIILGIAYIMLFVSGRQYLLFVLLAAVGVALIIFYISFWGYRSERIEIWKDPSAYDNGYQVMQGLYAIGSGGLFGKGLGESIQKQGFVPEVQNDMIFSIICEELGIIGALCVIIMYVLLIWRLMIIAMNAKETFDSFLVTGIIAQIAIQVVLNIAVVTNTIPNTGVTLPFISYGGSSIAILIAEIGLALGVSRKIYLT